MPACSAVVSNGGYAGASRESRGGGGGIGGGVCVEVSGAKGLCSVYGVTCGDGHI